MKLFNSFLISFGLPYLLSLLSVCIADNWSESEIGYLGRKIWRLEVVFWPIGFKNNNNNCWEEIYDLDMLQLRNVSFIFVVFHFLGSEE